MSGTEQFYDVLGVSADAEPVAVREHARERLDAFRERVANADDPAAEERRLLLAYEVLTDPEERYLYELYGHDEYVSRRLDGDELTEFEAASGSGGLTPVFGADDSGSNTRVFDPDAQAGDDTDRPDGTANDETRVAATDAATAVGSDTDGDSDQGADDDSEGIDALSETASVPERLGRFGLSDSPLTRVPGISRDGPGRVVAAGYGLLGLGLLAGVGAGLPFGSASLGAVAAVAFLVPAGVTYVAACYGPHRELLTRTAIGAAAAALFLAVPAAGVLPTVPGSVAAVAGLTVGLSGVMFANAYVEATRNRIREGRKGETVRGGENLTRTDPRSGTADDALDAHDVLEAFADEYTTRTAAVASDLSSEATVHATRRLRPERHIRRRLDVVDTQYSEEVPAGEFPAVRNRLREDVHERNDHHPAGFTAETYRYLIPERVQRLTCPTCSGRTVVQCQPCGGNGAVRCSACGGDTRVECRRCNGHGRLDDGGGYRTCGNCGGNGYTPCGRCRATGTETCGRCNGAGRVTCDRCDGDGDVVQYVRLVREYDPETDVEYVTRSVPEEYLTDATGRQVKKDRTYATNPNAAEGDVFMSEHEVREIPTGVVTYEYAGDLYETYDVDGALAAPAYPRELGRRVTVSTGLGVAFVALYAYAVLVGPAGLP